MSKIYKAARCTPIARMSKGMSEEEEKNFMIDFLKAIPLEDLKIFVNFSEKQKNRLGGICSILNANIIIMNNEINKNPDI